MTKTCRCGRGKMSAYDGKCGHCRNARERKAHRLLLDATAPNRIVEFPSSPGSQDE